MQPVSLPPLTCPPTLSKKWPATMKPRLLELGDRAPRVADKMTDNYLYLGLLAILFPNATFIHSRRDLRDVGVSCWITNFRGLRWTNEPQHLAHRFTQYLWLHGPLGGTAAAGADS